MSVHSEKKRQAHNRRVEQEIAERKRQERERRPPRPEPSNPCARCVWLKTDGGKLFCPFPACVEVEGWSSKAPTKRARRARTRRGE